METELDIERNHFLGYSLISAISATTAADAKNDANNRESDVYKNSRNDNDITIKNGLPCEVEVGVYLLVISGVRSNGSTSRYNFPNLC